MFISYLFALQNTPVLVELVQRANDPKTTGLRAGQSAVLPLREFSFLYQGETDRHEIGFIDGEHLNRNEADVALWRQNRAVPCKMVSPTIAPWMEEADDIATCRMPSGNVRAFMPVAVETRQRKVLSGRRAAMLAGDDVVDVERERVSRGRQVTVFATAPRPLPNVTHQIGIHKLSAAQGVPSFGLDYREQVTDMQIAVEFGALVVSQLTGLRPFGQLSHAIDVVIRKSDRKQIRCGFRRQFVSRALHEPGPNPRFPVRTE